MVLLSLFILSSCVQPVVRDDEAPPAPLPSAPLEGAKLPDLKKKLWIMAVPEPDTKAEEFKDLSLGSALQAEVLRVIGRETSIFLVQSSDDENVMAPLRIEEKKDPVEVSRLLRGSDVSGFLKLWITRAAISRDGEKEPGIFKTRRHTLSFDVKWELYDTSTGNRVAFGTERPSVTETRSEMMGLAVPMSELLVKVRELSTRVGEDLARRLTPLSEKLAWSGRVLRIDGGRVYINAGRRSGLLVGDTLKISEPLREIVDPQTGAFMGTAPGRIKGTVKLVQYFGPDGSIAVLQSGGGMQADDRVELY